jgi:hypothetical protein
MPTRAMMPKEIISEVRMVLSGAAVMALQERKAVSKYLRCFIIKILGPSQN